MVGINWSSSSEIISQTIWSIIASEIDFMIFHAIFVEHVSTFAEVNKRL